MYFSKHLSLSKHSSDRIRQSAEDKGCSIKFTIAFAKASILPCSTTTPV